jgi:hypothetical protein
MMATTIVALHLDGHVATIGHVGDSRLYRLAPDGQLHRETADHSVVEEEVRAGRMTPEQASNHPSRNVISRALGAEETVEVDLKTMEIEDGTCFLLCSDGITRHIPDPELRELLAKGADLNAVCEEMKRRCYERGAEDNLTAVIVRIGDPAKLASLDDERTLVTERPPLQATMGGAASQVEQTMMGAQLDSELHDTVDAPSKSAQKALASSLAPTPPAAVSPTPDVVVPQAVARPRQRNVFKSFLRALLFLIALALVGAAAFVGGIYFQQQRQEPPQTADTSVKDPEPPPAKAPASAFEQQRALVDKDPKDWLVKTEGKPPAGIDEIELQYLYGRAYLLMGRYYEADRALKSSLSKLKEGNPLKVEVGMAEVVAAAGISRTIMTPKMVQDALRELENVGLPKNNMSPGGSPQGGVNEQVAPTPQPSP